jgi:hypothetical protein
LPQTVDIQDGFRGIDLGKGVAQNGPQALRVHAVNDLSLLLQCDRLRSQ